MIDSQSRNRLQKLFRREHRSFLRYVDQASPWASKADQPLVAKLHQLAEEDLDSLVDLADFMRAQRIDLPSLGAFPISFANFNFVAIRTLIEPLVAEQRKELADLENDASAITDQEARQVVDQLIEMNRKHLRDFEQLK